MNAQENTNWLSNETGVFYKFMPPINFDEALQGSDRKIKIEPADGEQEAWWLSIPGIIGDDLYFSIEEAKNVGDDIINRNKYIYSDIIVNEIGLDSRQWSFIQSSKITFINEYNRDVFIICKNYDLFELWNNDSLISSHSDAVSAAVTAMSLLNDETNSKPHLI